MIRNMLILVFIAGLWSGSVPVAAKDGLVESQLKKAGYSLPKPAKPAANYVTWRRAGNILYLSGHIDCIDRLRGKVGAGVSEQAAYKSAQNVGLCMLATIKDAVGDLDQVKQVLQIMGMVNAVPDFTAQPQVINGFSDLFVVAFGEAGKGARAAVGMGSLPGGLAVEINAVIELKM